MLALSDYAAKCGFRSAVLGLSGGIDSAVTAALAVEALGPDRVLGVAMPGPYSSAGSLRDARALAERLGIPLRGDPDRAGPRRVPGDARAAGRNGQAVADRGEPPGAHPRSDPDGALQPVRTPRALDGQQVRDRGRLLHALRRHGRRLRAASPTCRRRWSTRSPRSSTATASGSRAPSIEKPPSAELRPDQKDTDSLPPYDDPRSAHRGARGPRAARSRRRRAARASRCALAQEIARPHRPQRVQAPADAARAQGHGARLRRGPPLPDRAEVPCLRGLAEALRLEGDPGLLPRPAAPAHPGAARRSAPARPRRGGRPPRARRARPLRVSGGRRARPGAAGLGARGLRRLARDRRAGGRDLERSPSTRRLRRRPRAPAAARGAARARSAAGCAPGGTLFVSLPNVANVTVRAALAAGRFPYADRGILDRTHLRFYTRADRPGAARSAPASASRGRWPHRDALRARPALAGPAPLARPGPGLRAAARRASGRRSSATSS